MIIEAFNIGKVIEGQTIIRNLSFNCKKKSVIAVKGHNGSGKSTLLKMLAGIYEPTSGKLIRHTKNIGYVPEHFPENMRFKVLEYLFLTASFRGLSKQETEEMVARYVPLFGLEPFLHTPLKKCSKGTKQKIGLIQAMLIEPELLLLDEPLTGLDLDSQEQLIQLLEGLQIAIVFTSHENELVEKLAHQLLQIETGTVTTVGRQQLEKKKIIRFTFPNDEILHDFDVTFVDGKYATLIVNPSESDSVLLKLLERKCSIVDVQERTDI